MKTKITFIIIFVALAIFYASFAFSQATVQIPVSASTDDADEAIEDNIFVNPGDMNLTNSELEMIYDDNVLRLCHVKVGLRFNNVTVPQGAEILNAYIQFTCKQTTSGVVNLVIHGQNSNNPSPFASTSGNISSRPLTTASATWAPMGWYTANEAGLDQRTPNLKTIVQEIVNRSGWASGNSMVFIISGTGDSRTAYSYDGDAARAPVLYIQYSPAGIDNQEFNASVSVSPNPATKHFNVYINENLANDLLQFKLYDQLGKEVKNYYVEKINNGVYQFDINNLSAGIYLLNISNGKHQTTKKIITY